MRVLKFVCDRCGKIIEGDPIKINPIVESEDDDKCKFVYADSPERDYCQECSDEIHAFMMCVMKKKGPDKPKPGKPERKDLDIGKIMALKNAGWSQRKIAEEMRCSDATISKIVNSIMDAQRNIQ